MKTVYKYITLWKENVSIVFALVYLVCTVVFAVRNVGQAKDVQKMYEDGTYTQHKMHVTDFELIDCEVIDEMAFKGLGENAQMVYNGDIDSLYIDCLHSYGLSEFRAYYNLTGDGAYSEGQVLKPKKYLHYLVYDFPQGTKQVCMPYANAGMYFNSLEINRRDHINGGIFATADLFNLLALPALVFFAADFAISLAGNICLLCGAKNQDKKSQ